MGWEMDSAVSSGERGTRSFTGTGTGRDGKGRAHMCMWGPSSSLGRCNVRNADMS